jgi:hypothetical protein
MRSLHDIDLVKRLTGCTEPHTLWHRLHPFGTPVGRYSRSIKFTQFCDSSLSFVGRGFFTSLEADYFTIHDIKGRNNV